jgi:hypothetical protein
MINFIDVAGVLRAHVLLTVGATKLIGARLNSVAVDHRARASHGHT